MIPPLLVAFILGSAQQGETATAGPAIFQALAPDMVGPAYIMGDRVVYVSHGGSRMHVVHVGGDTATLQLGTGARLVDRDQPHRVFLYEPAQNLILSYRVDDASTDTLTVPFAPFEAEVIGVFPDGAVMSIRKSRGLPGWSGALPVGAYRDSVTLELHERNGRDDATAGEVIARIPGDEVMWLKYRYGGFSRTTAELVLFGQRLLVVRARDEVLVARTDLGEVQVLTQDGEQIGRFPIPGEERSISEARIAAERDRRVQALLGQRVSGELSEVMAILGDMGRSASPELDREQIAQEVARLPANEVAPPIDQLLVDGDGRIWARMTPMPEDSKVFWSAQGPEGRRRLVLCLPRDEALLDAKGPHLLTRVGVRDRPETDLLALKELAAVTNDTCL